MTENSVERRSPDERDDKLRSLYLAAELGDLGGVRAQLAALILSQEERAQTLKEAYEGGQETVIVYLKDRGFFQDLAPAKLGACLAKLCLFHGHRISSLSLWKSRVARVTSPFDVESPEQEAMAERYHGKKPEIPSRMTLAKLLVEGLEHPLQNDGRVQVFESAFVAIKEELNWEEGEFRSLERSNDPGDQSSAFYMCWSISGTKLALEVLRMLLERFGLVSVFLPPRKIRDFNESEETAALDTCFHGWPVQGTPKVLPSRALPLGRSIVEGVNGP